MSLISDDMGQAIELDNRSVLLPYTWPSDKAFPDDTNYGYPTRDLSFVVEGQWAKFPYLQRIKDLSYPRKYTCTAGSSDVKPKFGMYFGMLSHEEYGLPVVTMGIIQGGIHSDGIHTVYAQEVKDSEGTFHWTTTKTCTWSNHIFSNRESAMNHMRTHYRIVLVCPFCAIHGSHSYPSMRNHVKRCKGDHSELLESSDAEPGQYEPCFHKGDQHLPKEGLTSHTGFTYKLDDKQVNTKTIQQLIDKFKARAEKEVSAVHQAHALCRKCSGLATCGNSSKKSLYDVKTDTKGPPNKQKKSNSSSATPATAKPLASAAVSKAPKDSDIPEVKNLDDDELDYDNDVDDDAASDGSNQPSGPLSDDKPQDTDKTPQQDSHD